jgi:arylsulfatase A-like enzyme
MSVKRPHIILFNPDQWRGDVLGHMGNPAAVTPNLDAFAENEAVSFRHAYCQNPVCTPSRCSFMSGWYPHVQGHRTMYYAMHKNDPVLLRNLKKSGYHVWWGGKNDLIAGQEGHEDICDVYYKPSEKVERLWMIDKQDQWRGDIQGDSYYSFYVGQLPHSDGHDHYHDPDWANVMGAIEAIRNYDKDSGKPLCIFLPLTYPHPPYAAESEYYDMIDPRELPPRVPAPEDWSGYASMLKGIYQMQRLGDWDEARWTELRRMYYAMCARVDHQFALVMQALKDAGIYDDSAVFMFSDHGDYTGDYSVVEKSQNCFEDCLTRVPFLFKPPADCGVKPGVSDAMIELIDMCATVEELAGIKPEHTHFGKSLMPVATGQSNVHRDAVFCEGGRLPGEVQAQEFGPGGELRDSSNLYYPRMHFQQGDGIEHHKATMCRTPHYKFIHRMSESDAFYDLDNDPFEQNNLIDHPDWQEQINAHRLRMLQWYQQTCDVVPVRQDDRSFTK